MTQNIQNENQFSSVVKQTLTTGRGMQENSAE
jgi:hypothetical protein